MSSARLIIGDVLDVLATLPDDSVDLVVTSPPFLALRSYLPADHPDKAKEIGSEPTPGEFIDALLDVTEALDRVLAPHGSICIELGDTYSGSGGAGGDYGEGGLRDGQPRFRAGSPTNGNGSPRSADYGGHGPRDYQSESRPPRNLSTRPKYNDRDGDEDAGIIPARSHSRRDRPGWPIEKSLCLIPELYRVALVYGFNPLTGRETPRWRARNVVRWHRPNPPVGSLGDKFRPATSEMVVLCHSRTRYFDQEAVRGPGSPNTNPRLAKGVDRRPNDGKTYPEGNRDTLDIMDGDGTAPPLDTWIIPTAPYKGSHYATFPPALVIKPVLAMSPEWVCTTCGEPSRRLIEPTEEHAEHMGRDIYGKRSQEERMESGRTHAGSQPRISAGYVTTGWSECDCVDVDGSKWRKGVVLDPFAGSGTTLAVATGHGRDAIGIDLDERNAELCQQRIGMFLTVDHLSDKPVVA